MPRRLVWTRSTARLTLVAAGLALSLAVQAAPSLTQQRADFKKAYAVAQKGGDAWRPLARNLRDYPLYPWLPAAALEHDLAGANTAQVERYLKRYPHLLTSRDLRRNYLVVLAQRQSWDDFRKLYRPHLGTALSCYDLQARLAQGTSLHWHDLADLWQHAALPDACTPVQKWAHAHGLLTTARLWQRIDTAANAGRAGTVAALAQWLPATEQSQARHLLLALRQPAKAAKASPDWPDNARSRQTVTLAMRILARRSSDQAAKLWPGVKKHFHLTSTQSDHILAAMALYTATDFTDTAVKQLAALPPTAQTDATRAWRVRVALAKRDWRAALAALDALSDAQKREGEWLYLRARVFGKLGYAKAARQLYAKVAKSATYYGFLAADRTGLPYAICPTHISGDPAGEQALLHRPAMQRAFELFAVGLLRDARRVWVRALADDSARTRQLAALLANQRGWYDRAIRTFSHGNLKHLYNERFPLAREDGVTTQSADAGIDPAWAYAIIRAESAWMPDARSGADARGLMQLLPATARLVAKRQHIAFDGNLYDPATNIALGTHYLAHMAARYGGAPYLATAAYNAGPQRVDEWLAQRGTLAPDLFVATIPFHETRDYVMRVMAYSVIYDWRMHGNAVALSQRMPRYGTPYAPPTARTTRKSVACAP
ncbi:MAG TPA: transglycosylase SLT domain-containing protein [Rhodanobacteraceae bacterium]